MWKCVRKKMEWCNSTSTSEECFWMVARMAWSACCFSASSFAASLGSEVIGAVVSGVGFAGLGFASWPAVDCVKAIALAAWKAPTRTTTAHTNTHTHTLSLSVLLSLCLCQFVCLSVYLSLCLCVCVCLDLSVRTCFTAERVADCNVLFRQLLLQQRLAHPHACTSTMHRTGVIEQRYKHATATTTT